MAKDSIVSVVCKLPHGLVIEHPLDPKNTITLNGRNKETIIGSGYGLTPVPTDFWEQWEAANSEFAPVKSGAIFAANNPASAQSMAKEFKDRKTGFEPLKGEEFGVVKADKE